MQTNLLASHKMLLSAEEDLFELIKEKEKLFGNCTKKAFKQYLTNKQYLSIRDRIEAALKIYEQRNDG